MIKTMTFDKLRNIIASLCKYLRRVLNFIAKSVKLLTKVARYGLKDSDFHSLSSFHLFILSSKNVSDINLKEAFVSVTGEKKLKDRAKRKLNGQLFFQTSHK